MRKMSTLFRVTHEGQKTTIYPEIRDENRWVFAKGTKATVKFDGTAVLIKQGLIYKRYDAKHGKIAPEGAIPCQPLPDPFTGHHPHWVICDISNPADKYFFEGFSQYQNLPDGTYELCGKKIGINAEGLKGHKLLKHGTTLAKLTDWSFEGIREYLRVNNVEGIVFHGVNGERCKIRKTDFGFTRKKPILNPKTK